MAVKTIRAVPLVIGYQHPEAARRDRAYKQDTYPVSLAHPEMFTALILKTRLFLLAQLERAMFVIAL